MEWIIKNYINGVFKSPVDYQWLTNINPAKNKSIGQIPLSNKKDIDDAVLAAEEAFPQWSNTSVEYRSEMLRKISYEIKQELAALAEAESIDNGKPVGLAKKVDIPRAASNFNFFADAITQFDTRAHEMHAAKAINFSLRHPHGIVACISPWNLPLYLFTWKIAPALATGNCVVAKPSEITPLTAFLLSKICKKVGLPPGVLNIVHGYGHAAGDALIKHPKVKAITFTGGTTTGKKIAQSAAPEFKKLSLELGGKNPNIIFADCDYDKMLNTTISSSFANQGQICLCGSRIFVEHSIYNRFKADFIHKVDQLKIGDPLNHDTEFGALVSAGHLKKVEHYCELARKDDQSEIIYGGHRLTVKDHENGFFFSPSIIEVKDNQCVINQEEIFGPIVSLMSFETEEEVLAMANDTQYGLSASVWTSDINRAMYFSQHLESGVIWINTWLKRDLRTPFGGMKSSGVGREGGLDALHFFTEPKNICIDYN
jgi:aminomuconate-semialdehyde/2-hydroxymuconate-6-semialdehyde dehydrogenase